MIKLGKLENGFVIFDYKTKTKVSFIVDNQKVRISFDYQCNNEQLNHDNELEVIRKVVITRNENIELCKVLDELYLAQFDVIKKQGGKLNNKSSQLLVNELALYRIVDGGIELRLPSDDNSIDECTIFGITENKDKYILMFDYSMNQNKNEVIINKDSTRFPKLYTIYSNACYQITQMPISSFQYESNDFNSYLKNPNLFLEDKISSCMTIEQYYISIIQNGLDKLSDYAQESGNERFSNYIIIQMGGALDKLVTASDEIGKLVGLYPSTKVISNKKEKIKSINTERK